MVGASHSPVVFPKLRKLEAAAKNEQNVLMCVFQVICEVGAIKPRKDQLLQLNDPRVDLTDNFSILSIRIKKK